MDEFLQVEGAPADSQEKCFLFSSTATLFTFPHPGLRIGPTKGESLTPSISKNLDVYVME